jgi:hypothetical protein
MIFGELSCDTPLKHFMAFLPEAKRSVLQFLVLDCQTMAGDYDSF